jgi:hypothetical protein
LPSKESGTKAHKSARRTHNAKSKSKRIQDEARSSKNKFYPSNTSKLSRWKKTKGKVGDVIGIDTKKKKSQRGRKYATGTKKRTSKKKK